MALSNADLDDLVNYTGDLIPTIGQHLQQVVRLWPLLYLLWQVEKKYLPSEEYMDYGVHLHVVDYNLECSIFVSSENVSFL
jgi:hypothetical protein